MSASAFARFEPRRPDPELGANAPVSVRRARLEDTEAIGALVAARDGGELAAHVARLRRQLGADDAGESAIMLVAEADGAIVAHASARHVGAPSDPAVDPAPAGWYLTGVVVDPAWRRRGIAARLTEGRLAWLAERTDVA